MIIALEGPSYAGKTTALRHLRATDVMADALILECYVRSIPRPEDIPRPATESAAEQLAAFGTFMAVEERRVLQAAAHHGPVGDGSAQEIAAAVQSLITHWTSR